MAARLLFTEVAPPVTVGRSISVLHSELSFAVLKRPFLKSTSRGYKLEDSHWKVLLKRKDIRRIVSI